MHHSHDLDTKSYQSLQNQKIKDEVCLYVECGIPTAQIHELLVEKYQFPISFEQVLRLCCQLKSELRREALPSLTDLGLKETELEQAEERITHKTTAPKPIHQASDADQFVALLEELKLRDDRVRYAYEYQEDESGQGMDRL